MNGLEDLEILPTGEHLQTELKEQAQLLRNCYETADPQANQQLFYLLILKYVTNDQVRETIQEVSTLSSTLSNESESL